MTLAPRDSKGKFIGWINGCPDEISKKIGKKLIGHEVSEKTREKIRKTLKNGGFTPPEEYWIKKGTKPWNNGIKGICKPNSGSFKKEHQPIAGFKKGLIPWNKNKKVPQTSGENHWSKNKKMLHISGKNNWNWTGGKSKMYRRVKGLLEYINWRKAVFERDDYICQKCGLRSGKGTKVYLEAHHNIKKLNDMLREYKIETLEEASKCKELWDVDNGLTLCKKCHLKVHRLLCQVRYL